MSYIFRIPSLGYTSAGMVLSCRVQNPVKHTFASQFQFCRHKRKLHVLDGNRVPTELYSQSQFQFMYSVHFQKLALGVNGNCQFWKYVKSTGITAKSTPKKKNTQKKKQISRAHTPVRSTSGDSFFPLRRDFADAMPRRG